MPKPAYTGIKTKTACIILAELNHTLGLRADDDKVKSCKTILCK